MCSLSAAYFSLDPNRALDVILDVLEGRLSDSSKGQQSCLLGVLARFSRTSLVQVLGFKLGYYHKSRVATPRSLLGMAAALIRADLVKIEELYVHLGGTDEAEGKSEWMNTDGCSRKSSTGHAQLTWSIRQCQRHRRFLVCLSLFCFSTLTVASFRACWLAFPICRPSFTVLFSFSWG